MSDLRIFGTADDSIVDGPGIRFAVFAQGCMQGCPGCHNPESHPYTGGSVVSVDDLWHRVETNPLISGVTLSGGEPFDQAAAFAELARLAHKYHKDVWAYTGYLFEDIVDGTAGKKLNNPHYDVEAARDLLRNIDVLVDGRFDETQKSYDLHFKGSKNQRLIDVQESLEQNATVLWEE
jgi:anaerobic ribonucleoside-triphosphate reductase activating protein